MRFATPLALLLLFVLPLIWHIGWPRQAFRRRRDIVSLILRSAIVFLVVLSLSGAQIVQAVDRLAVVFLVDVSDSIGQQARTEQLAYIQEAVANKPPEDEWAIVVFGAGASVESSFSNATAARPFESHILTTHTDIARAIDTAISLFPADTNRRIVILSDGQETLGNAESRARLAAASGVEISYVPVYRDPIPDARVINLNAPLSVIENQEFDITVTVEAEEAVPATIRVFSDGRIIYEEAVDLRAGVTNYTLTRTSAESGFLNFSAQIEVAGDDYFGQNNRLSAFSQVIGPPRVLLVASDRNEIANLLPALQQAELNVEIVEPGELTPGISGLATYKSVILVNVPATELSRIQMEALDQYVRDIGGGLVFIGGPDSYAPGGYFQTPIERTLPVEMRIDDQQRLPRVTIAYLIDRSGSMGAIGRSGVPNIELAKEAIIRSIDFLQATDKAGVASFDTSGSWLAEIQPVYDRRELQQFVAQLRSGGGTSIMAGLRLVSPDLIADDSERKHIILLTDGGASPEGLIELTTLLYEENDVTTSVIAIGIGSAGFLRVMAESGGGNYHAVEDVAQIPTIFAQETVLSTRSYIVEEEFSPILTASSPIMSGITSLPALKGYVAATPKTAAQVVLTTDAPFRDPLLAGWQYGLGRSVAFASDATSRWAADWVMWDDFPRFWGQVVNWTISEGISDNLETRVVMEGGQSRMIVDARDDSGAFLNNLDLRASILFPDGESEAIHLRQVAPGRYESLFTPQEEGAYFLVVNGERQAGDQILELNQVNGWVMSYSPEYLKTGANEALLAKLADITGGRLLRETPGDVFAHNLEARAATAPLWPLFLVVALILFPVDIAARRLIITRSDIQRAQALLFGREVLERSEHMSTLMRVRERARRQTGYGESERAIAVLRGQRAVQENIGAAPVQSSESDSSKAASSIEHGENIGARLLKTRRKRPEERE